MLNKTILAISTSLFFTGISFAQTIVLKNANVIDVVGQEVLQNQTLVIKDDRINYIGRAKKKNKDATVIDLEGKYIIPGLIDAHVHHATDSDAWDNQKDTLTRLRLLLQGGVTSVRDMGGDARALTYLKRLAEIDQVQSPDIYFSVIIGGPDFFTDPRTMSSAKGRKSGDTDWTRSVTAESDFEEIILKGLGTGATGIKIYAAVGPEVVAGLSKAAKKHGMKVWSHAYVGPLTPLQAINNGVETISHAPDITAQVAEDFDQWRRRDKTVTEAEWEKTRNLDQYTELLASMKKNHTLLDATLSVFNSTKHYDDKQKNLYKSGVIFTQWAYENGIDIVAGTDEFVDVNKVAMPPLHNELELLVNDAKLSPYAALKAATYNAAKAIGIEDKVGSVEEGKIANLIVLDKNPLDDISNTTSISHVLKNGHFVYLGDDKSLPFSSAKKVNDILYLSGVLGNHPSTKVLAGESFEIQMSQALKNIGSTLEQYQLTYSDIDKCTLMLADIKDWDKANEVYTKYFSDNKPVRSAFAVDGLALKAKVEIECQASF